MFISLAPGFSPVLVPDEGESRLNGLGAHPEAAEAAEIVAWPRITGLKPGANEKSANL
jgi:hypothetical protein